MRAGYIFKFFAGEALRIPGKVMQSVRPGVGVEVTREAIGVVGLITPWNFPIAIPAWKAAPALAHGKSVLVKPAAPGERKMNILCSAGTEPYAQPVSGGLGRTRLVRRRESDSHE